MAVHDFTQTFGNALEPEEPARQQAEYPAVSHPVVRTHPETGRRLISSTASSPTTSRACRTTRAANCRRSGTIQARHPEYQCRLRRRPGTVAFWDNRATQHYASADYYPHKRIMERVTILGDRPF